MGQMQQGNLLTPNSGFHLDLSNRTHVSQSSSQNTKRNHQTTKPPTTIDSHQQYQQQASCYRCLQLSLFCCCPCLLAPSCRLLPTPVTPTRRPPPTQTPLPEKSAATTAIPSGVRAATIRGRGHCHRRRRREEGRRPKTFWPALRRRRAPRVPRLPPRPRKMMAAPHRWVD